MKLAQFWSITHPIQFDCSQRPNIKNEHHSFYHRSVSASFSVFVCKISFFFFNQLANILTTMIKTYCQNNWTYFWRIHSKVWSFASPTICQLKCTDLFVDFDLIFVNPTLTFHRFYFRFNFEIRHHGNFSAITIFFCFTYANWCRCNTHYFWLLLRKPWFYIWLSSNN